jgi:uncharacterized membrane protein YgdD (TMEM256/DUF423 family)
MKQFLVLGAIFGFLAVAFGAFGAHAIKNRISADMLEVYKTAVQYQMYHAFALIAVALLLKFFPDSRMFTMAGYFFTAGIILFSGSLYGLSLSEIKAFGPVTPFGGLCFLTGWVMVPVGAMRAA